MLRRNLELREFLILISYEIPLFESYIWLQKVFCHSYHDTIWLLLAVIYSVLSAGSYAILVLYAGDGQASQLLRLLTDKLYRTDQSRVFPQSIVVGSYVGRNDEWERGDG